jgi:hypothetical protein
MWSSPLDVARTIDPAWIDEFVGVTGPGHQRGGGET